MSTVSYQASEFGSPIQNPISRQVLALYLSRHDTLQNTTFTGSLNRPVTLARGNSGIFDIKMKERIKKTDRLLTDPANNFQETEGQLITVSVPAHHKTTISSRLRPERPLWWPRMSVTVEGVIDSISRGGFGTIAKRLMSLHETILEEREEKPIVVGSLQNFSRFIFTYQLPNPKIGVTPDGLIQAVWRIQDYGTLVMNFLPLTDIMFAAVYAQHDLDSPRRKISGVQPPQKMMRIVEDFANLLTA